MNKQSTLFEDLPVELFHLIFEYLPPHDLFKSFNNLNQRFASILSRQPLFIPNNRSMNINLYFDYLTSIIPNNISQIAYLHLSERYSPHAVDHFISTVPLEAYNWPALKAVIIEDVPFHALETLLDEDFLLSKAHFVSIDIGVDRYHHSEYNNYDFDVVLPILKYLPQLRSLYIRMHGHTADDHSSAINQYCPSMTIHQNLHTLMIHHCSRELLVLMLNDGHLSQLCRLHVSLECSHEAQVIEPPCPTPLKSTSVPKLSYISIHIMVGLAWVLNYFQELQVHSQLEYMKITGHVRFTVNNCVPRVSTVKRWLLLNKSKEFKFEMKLFADAEINAFEIQKRIVTEYNKAIGIKKTTYHRSINLNYSASDKTFKNNKDPRVELFDQLDDIDEYAVKMELVELNCITDALLEYLQSIDRWYCLRKITLICDIINEIDETIGDNIPLLLHIAQRAPYFREFCIEEDLELGHVMSSNVQLGILFISQIEIFCYTAQNSNCSLGDLVKIVDKLFAHSSSPILKELILNIDGNTSSWVSVDHLFVYVEKILDRFPALIHLTLNCKNDTNSLLKLAPLWHQRLLDSRPYLINSLEYRCKTHLLEIWL